MLLLGQTVGECKAKALAEVRELKRNPKQAVVAIAEESRLARALRVRVTVQPGTYL